MLRDRSISVREAAVDILGRYITASATLSEKYCPIILERIKDKGPSVRKKAIVVLSEIVTNSALPEELTSTIIIELVKRIHDDTDLIKATVAKTFERLWGG